MFRCLYFSDIAFNNNKIFQPVGLFCLKIIFTVNNYLHFAIIISYSFFFRGQLHQQCCEEWTLVSEETQAKMARMAAAAAWGLGNGHVPSSVINQTKRYGGLHHMVFSYLSIGFLVFFRTLG